MQRILEPPYVGSYFLNGLLELSLAMWVTICCNRASAWAGGLCLCTNRAGGALLGEDEEAPAYRPYLHGRFGNHFICGGSAPPSLAVVILSCRHQLCGSYEREEVVYHD